MVCAWLASAAPPLAPSVTAAMLDDGRAVLDLKRSKASPACATLPSYIP